MKKKGLIYCQSIHTSQKQVGLAGFTYFWEQYWKLSHIQISSHIIFSQFPQTHITIKLFRVKKLAFVLLSTFLLEVTGILWYQIVPAGNITQYLLESIGSFSNNYVSLLYNNYLAELNFQSMFLWNATQFILRKFFLFNLKHSIYFSPLNIPSTGGANMSLLSFHINMTWNFAACRYVQCCPNLGRHFW